MELNFGILIAQLINFTLIFFAFKYFVGNKLILAIKKRREELAKAEDATKIYDEIMQQAELDKKALIDEGLDHKNKLLEEAKLSAIQKGDAIIHAAEKNAISITQQAKQKAAKLETDLKMWFVDGVKKTTHVVVKKLFDKDVNLQEKYLDELVGDFVK